VLVYPLFLARGYFADRRLPQLLAGARSGAAQSIRILPPLGLDPALVDVIAGRIDSAIRERAIESRAATVVVLAHGSTSDEGSRSATTRVVHSLRALQRYHDVRAAFLDEPPSLGAALVDACGPALVAGLFAGEGLHGGEDTKSLIGQLRRNDVSFIGNLGTWPEIADVIAAAIAPQVQIRSSLKT
jgi:sirohydrochlorin ferrochelatase